MSPFFNGHEAVARLQAVAKSWLGTPFMPNACIKGAGVSCQQLAGAIYRECGFVTAPIPEGPMNWSHANTRSLVAEWMDAQPEFIPLNGPAKSPGDLLGFRIGGCVQHVGILLSADGTFIHCFRKEGTILSSLMDSSYFTRLDRVWVPLHAVGLTCRSAVQ